jgi:peptide/nickel transport system substrate-binding protein
MNASTRLLLPLMIASALLAACAPATSSVGTGETAGGGAPAPLKTITLGEHYETDSLAGKYRTTLAGGAKRLVNAGLTLKDNQDIARPYLADAVPQLNTDTWRLFPDGRMETTYRLRPNLTWHDGTALSAEDFVLAWRVYRQPSLDVFEKEPQSRMDDLSAPDDRTIVIRWNTSTIEGGQLDFPPVARHFVARPYEDLLAGVTTNEAFLSLPYWRAEYVGLGPYKLSQWELGAFLQFDAFPGHALGRPRIDRVVIVGLPDENVMMTSVLARKVDFTLSLAIRFEHAQVLLKEWHTNKQGIVVLEQTQRRFTEIQWRPAYLKVPAFTDLRVRKAIAFSLDRQAIVDGLFDGLIPPSDSFVFPTAANFAETERTIAHYPLDLRQAESLLNDAGWRKGTDGVYANAGGERFAFEHMAVQGDQNNRQNAIMSDSWRQAGFDVRQTTLSTALSGDGEARGTFPGLSTVSGGGFNSFSTSVLSSPATRWVGTNRSGFSHPEYDRLYEAYLTGLDASEQLRLEVQMMKVVTENVGGIFLFLGPGAFAYRSDLVGPAAGNIIWNVHDWDLAS